MSRTGVIWRRLLVPAIAMCAGVVPALSASAHNGVGAAFKGKAGHYIVYAYDGELLPAGRIDYKLVLLNGQTKDPVYDAHPSVTAARPGSKPTNATLTTFGNVFFYNLPNPYPHDWNVRLRITGPLGAGEVTYRMHGAAPSGAAPIAPVVTDAGSSNWPLIAGTAIGALLLAGLVYLLVRWKERRLPASPR